ncbi:MAG: BCCT family transporter, partial [Rhodospirillaceae bacterium]|nr:BCCT family transporter [Rhodospirillaceae bacterium]
MADERPLATTFMGMRACLPVFFSSVALIAIFVIATLSAGEDAAKAFKAIQGAIAENAGWFFVLTANVMLGFAVYLLFSRFGSIRLGGEDARPEFSTISWIAMLFSAGMGIGLVFWAVAEPLYHYSGPPVPPLDSAAKYLRAQEAMGLTFLHWGLHPWAIYAVLGLGLAYANFNKGLPLSIRSIFYPLMGDRINGLWGHVIDIIAILATLFGVATSLGLGVSQVNAGLDASLGTGQSLSLKLWLIAGITAIATISVVTGVKKGIKLLSELNMALAGMLLLFVLVAGPTLFLLNGFIENIGYYVQNFARLATWGETYTAGDWQNSWTVFYYAWWISWSPFVGMFIARISKGRTVREFTLSVLVVPTVVGFLWLTVFGGAALNLEMAGTGGLMTALKTGVENALFALLQTLPGTEISLVLATIVIVTFFV